MPVVSCAAGWLVWKSNVPLRGGETCMREVGHIGRTRRLQGLLRQEKPLLPMIISPIMRQFAE